MARIALGITIALLLATCFFGYENHEKVAGLIEDKRQISLQISSIQTQMSRAKADLATSQDNLSKETADDEQTKTQLASVQSDLDSANAKVTDEKSQIDNLNAQIATIKGNQGQVNTLLVYTQAHMDKVLGQVKEARAQVAELNTIKDTLTNKAKDADARADDLEKTVEHYKNATLKNGLQGEVLAYNPGFNFVVLSIGDRQGAVANAEMILERGGSQIGKVRITSVEPSTSVADIIPGSLARGVRVQPGDIVIFPGS